MNLTAVDTLAPLIRLLVADAVQSLQSWQPRDDEPHSVMFLLDEFDQLGRQPFILNSIKTIRSYKGRFFIISQSIPGLDGVYGETDRLSLIAGAGVQIYMTPSDPTTANVLSDALGKKTIVSKTRSHSAIRSLTEGQNLSRRSEERPLITSGELLRHTLDEVFVLPEGQYPIKADHIKYYADAHFAPFDAARVGHSLPYPDAEGMGSGNADLAADYEQSRIKSAVEDGHKYDDLASRAAVIGRKTQSGSGKRKRPVKA